MTSVQYVHPASSAVRSGLAPEIARLGPNGQVEQLRDKGFAIWTGNARMWDAARR